MANDCIEVRVDVSKHRIVYNIDAKNQLSCYFSINEADRILRDVRIICHDDLYRADVYESSREPVSTVMQLNLYSVSTS